MERCMVNIRIYKVLENVKFARDELIGSLLGNKIRYTDKEMFFYDKYDNKINSIIASAHWEVDSSRKLDKHKSYNGHNPVFISYYLKRRTYSDFICPYYEIRKDYTDKVYSSIVKPKYSESKILPLSLIKSRLLFDDDFTKSYWHHPRKELVTDNPDKFVSYLKKYLIEHGGDSKDKFINDMIGYIPEKNPLLVVYWNDDSKE